MPQPQASGDLKSHQITYLSGDLDLRPFDLGTGLQCSLGMDNLPDKNFGASATFLCRVMG